MIQHSATKPPNSQISQHQFVQSKLTLLRNRLFMILFQKKENEKIKTK